MQTNFIHLTLSGIVSIKTQYQITLIQLHRSNEETALRLSEIGRVRVSLCIRIYALLSAEFMKCEYLLAYISCKVYLHSF